MTDLLSLEGRVVVVSGAGGGGIGTTVTRLAAEAGATVIAVSRSKDNLDAHVAPLADRGLPVIPVAADASTDEGIETVLEAVRTADGTPYGLVNIAGGAAPGTWMPATRVSRSDWRELFTANLETMFFMSQAMAAEIRAAGDRGSIVSVSSISGMNSAPFHIAYGTAKAAIVAATRTLAVELAPTTSVSMRSRPASPRPRHRPPTSTPTRTAIGGPSPWAAGAHPRSRPERFCSCCPIFPDMSPGRRCWSTADSICGGHIWERTTPRCS